MTAPRIGGGHVPIDPGTGLVWGSDGAGNATPVNGAAADQLAVAAGLKGWVAHPWTPGNSVFALTSQVITCMGVWLPAGTTVTNIVLNIGAVAVGTVPTGFYVGLAKSNGTMVAQSGNLNSSASLTTAGYQSFPLSATYTTNATDSPTGFYYIVVLQNGAFGTTNPTFLFYVTTGGVVGAYGANPRLSAKQTGQTVLPANGSAITLADSSSTLWAGVS